MVEDFKKKCHKCGEKLLAKNMFCSQCGTAVRLFSDDEVLHMGMCPSCGRYKVLRAGYDNRPFRSLYCIKCGYTTRTVEIFYFPGSLEAAIEIIKDDRRYGF